MLFLQAEAKTLIVEKIELTGLLGTEWLLVCTGCVNEWLAHVGEKLCAKVQSVDANWCGMLLW